MNRQSWPATLYLRMILGSVQELLVLHQSEHIHCDIKINNFLFDLATLLIPLVDFGSALPYDAKQKKAMAYAGRGAKHYSAPECEKDNNSFKVKIVYYSEKSDVFSLGKFIGELLDEISATEKKSTDHKKNTGIENDTTVRKFVEQMQSPKPDERPTLIETHSFFNALYRKYKEKNPDQQKQIDALQKAAIDEQRTRLFAIYPQLQKT